MGSVDGQQDICRTKTHFADEEDGVTLATPTGLVLDLEMRDGERIANGRFEFCDVDWHCSR